jgi:methyl-accepting chemotaxis protein
MDTKMTVTTKLYASYGAMALIALVMGVTCSLSFLTIGSSTRQMGTVTAKKLFSAGMISRTSTRMVSLERALLLRSVAKDPTGVAHFASEYRKTEDETRGSLKALEQMETDPQGIAILTKLNHALSESTPIFDRLEKQVADGSLDAALTTNVKELSPKLLEITDASVEMMTYQEDQMAGSSSDTQQTVTRSQISVAVLLVLAIAVGGCLAYVIRALTVALRRTSFDLADGSSQVSSAATQVASSSQGLAKDTSEQAAMIEETSASAEEINSMARRNAESAKNATLIVDEAEGGNQETNRAVSECVEAMDVIGESSTKIARTLQVIDKIAFQTNILALNAAVEAARAGEAGMGFAVVAEEVRNLAQRCAAASEEISTLIEESLKNSDSGRSKMKVLVTSGIRVNDLFASMKVLVKEISLSSEEQGRGIDQIGRAIQKMEQGTQKSAANAEESAAAAEQLNAQSNHLREISDELKSMVGA